MIKNFKEICLLSLALLDLGSQAEPKIPPWLPETMPTPEPTSSLLTEEKTQVIYELPVVINLQESKAREIKPGFIIPQGNQRIGLGNGFFLPYEQGHVLSRIPIQLNGILNKNGQFNLEKLDQLPFCGRRQQVVEIVKKGLPVNLVIEMGINNEFAMISEDQFGQFCQRLARQFNYPQVKFIFGNEINVPESSWRGKEKLYVQYYLAGSKAIKEVNPQAQVLPFGDAYYGSQEDSYFADVLKPILLEMKRLGREDLIDAVDWHFHDADFWKMMSRAKMYRNLLDQMGFSNKPLILAEAGLPIDTRSYSDKELADYVTAMVASMVTLQTEGLITEGLFFAGVDPNSPSSLAYESGGLIIGKPALQAFYLSREMFYEQVNYLGIDGLGLAQFTGTTLQGDRVRFLFNTTLKRQAYLVDSELEKPLNTYGQKLTLGKDGKINIESKSGLYLLTFK